MNNLLARLNMGSQVPEFELRQEAATEIRRLRAALDEYVKLDRAGLVSQWPNVSETRTPSGIRR